jgi:hypothetical protein
MASRNDHYTTAIAKFCTDLLDTNVAVFQQLVQVRQMVLWSMLQYEIY